MPQLRGFCGHLKPSYDNHSTCAACCSCSIDNKCSVCIDWDSYTWSLFQKKRLYSNRPRKKKMTSKGSKKSEKFTMVADRTRGSTRALEPSDSGTRRETPKHPRDHKSTQSVSRSSSDRSSHQHATSSEAPPVTDRSGSDPGDDPDSDNPAPGDHRASTSVVEVDSTSDTNDRDRAPDRSIPPGHTSPGHRSPGSNSVPGRVQSPVDEHSSENDQSLGRQMILDKNDRSSNIPGRHHGSSRDRSIITTSKRHIRRRSPSHQSVAVHRTKSNVQLTQKSIRSRSKQSGQRSRSRSRSVHSSHRHKKRRTGSRSRSYSRRSRSSSPRRHRRKHRSSRGRRRYVSSSSTSSSSSRSSDRDYRRRQHKSHKHKRYHKRKRSTSSGDSQSEKVDSSNKSPSPVHKRVSSVKHSAKPQSTRQSSPSLSIRVEDTKELDNDLDSRASVEDFNDLNSSEIDDRISYASVIDAIFEILPSDKFPKQSESSSKISRPKSCIEEDIGQEQKKSISLPQSPLVSNTIDFIQHQVKDKIIPEDWCIKKKDQDALINLKYYQSHNEKVSTSRDLPLDNDASRLGMSLTGNTQIPVKNLAQYEKQLRDLLRTLSHADVFSYAAFRSAKQEEPDCTLLLRILEALAKSINASVSLASILTTEMVQMRREAAIRSAPKSLSDMAKNKLRSTPFNSPTLFGGKIEQVYKENSDTLRDELVTKTITSSQAKSQTSSSTQGKPEFKIPKIGTSFPTKIGRNNDRNLAKGSTSYGGRGSFRGSRGSKPGRGNFSSRGKTSTFKKQ